MSGPGGAVSPAIGPHERVVTVTVTAVVNVRSYQDAYGDTADLAEYTATTVRDAAHAALRRVEWGRVEGIQD